MNKIEPSGVYGDGRGTLYVVATPIGNMGDISGRAIEVLSHADMVAAEDTRHTGLLLSRLGISVPLISCHEHNEVGRSQRILAELGEGKSVALVSDAGTPGISDPGEVVIAQAIEAGFHVVPIPGPTAFVPALTISGLPTSQFMFVGFLPRKPKERRRALAELASVPATLIFYEAPHRLAAMLDDAAHELGDRRIAVCWELTKKFERIWRGSLSCAVAQAGHDDRGEVVIVVEGARKAECEAISLEQGVIEAAADAVAVADAGTGTSLKDAAEKAATRAGVPWRKVYAEAIKLQRGKQR